MHKKQRHSYLRIVNVPRKIKKIVSCHEHAIFLLHIDTLGVSYNDPMAKKHLSIDSRETRFSSLLHQWFYVGVDASTAASVIYNLIKILILMITKDARQFFRENFHSEKGWETLVYNNRCFIIIIWYWLTDLNTTHTKCYTKPLQDWYCDFIT